MLPVKRIEIRSFGGKILGYVEEDKDGNQQCKSFGGKILGYYDASSDTTREFGGRVVSRGNTVVGFLYR